MFYICRDPQPVSLDIAAETTSTTDLQSEENRPTSQVEEIERLSLLLEEKSNECDRLQRQLELERFGVNRFTTDDTLILFYTGFSSYKQFLMFYTCIEPNAQNMKSMYYVASDTLSLAGRKRNMLLIDELFMFLCRLRAGHMEQDLAVRFNTSLPTVSRKIITWANFLYFVLGKIPIWLKRETIDEFMPECFKVAYPKTRVVIDCTEIRTQHPSSLVLNSQMYSTYKGACTFKCLLGISPHGLVTFISPLFTGCMSDVEITRLSGILDLLEPGDEVMADKGFTLTKVLAEKHVKLTIPAFLSNKKKFTVNEIKETEQIAKLRIHIERVNRRIKEYHLFDTPIPLSLAGSANQLWTIACLLSNFKGPIVQTWKQ